MKTTKKDFEEYKKWVNYYLKRFGLNDWTVYFYHEAGPAKSSIASCTPAILSRALTFRLATEPDIEKDQLEIRTTARHEVCHALIANLSHLVGSYCSEDEWKKADEELVCRLTNLLNDEM